MEYAGPYLALRWCIELDNTGEQDYRYHHAHMIGNTVPRAPAHTRTNRDRALARSRRGSTSTSRHFPERSSIFDTQSRIPRRINFFDLLRRVIRIMFNKNG